MNGQDHDGPFRNPEVDGVREATEDGAACLFVCTRKARRVGYDALDHSVDFHTKPAPEPSAAAVVPSTYLKRFVLRLRSEDNVS